MYNFLDNARWVVEEPKSIFRTEFERDRARVLHSSALRRLGAKTQVSAAGFDDFVRTRLTHSLEVAQIGRELAGALGCDRDIVDMACLAHDLGHPPFGHNGESVLNDLACDIGGFEGNAQTLRLLTSLEGKIFSDAGKSVGLNLTRAGLDATCKYPWTLAEAKLFGFGGEDSCKFGVYEDDLEVFKWLRLGAVGFRKCLEAQVMDLADDISYSVHDVEDAMVSQGVDLRLLADSQIFVKLCGIIRQRYVKQASDSTIFLALQRLQTTSFWVSYVDGSRKSLAGVKNMASELIGRFCVATIAATRQRFGQQALVRFSGDLVVPEETSLEIAVLKGIVAMFIMLDDKQQIVYKQQKQVLLELVQVLQSSGEKYLEPMFVQDWGVCENDGQRFRVIVDQVAALTDISAVAWHRRLVG